MIQTTPTGIFSEYQLGNEFKAGIGERGLFEQSKINERFYVGDQWYGAKCGSDRPLVRHNVIKRIGDYKMAVVASAPVAVSYSAEGLPHDASRKVQRQDAAPLAALQATSAPGADEIDLVMAALSDYHRVTAERVKFEEKKELLLRNAYISGTGFLYTYWDDTIPTGLYADDAATVPICGDIACEVLDVENLVFGEPGTDDIEAQPYVIIAQRLPVAEIKRMAKRFGRPAADIEAIKPDRELQYLPGQRSEQEPQNAERTLLLTKLFKEVGPDGRATIQAVQVARGAVVRPVWSLGLSRYPLAKFTWERRRSSIYGDSEITYLVPNQIAINRTLTASVWSMILMGMPIMVRDVDAIQGPISNMPGQIIDVARGGEGVRGMIDYIQPPVFAPQFQNMINDLITNTLTQSGANDAALGDVRPDNASAIIAVREAATMPMQTVQNRFYQFCEDVARIWADFWMHAYGARALRLEDSQGAWYLPFDAARYRDLLIRVRVDVGAATLWGEAQLVSTLDGLYDRGVITAEEYLKRLPAGLVPELGDLLARWRTQGAVLPADGEAASGQALLSGEMPSGSQAPEDSQALSDAILAALSEEDRLALASMPEETRAQLLERVFAEV